MNWISEGKESIGKCMTADSDCNFYGCIVGCNFCIGTVTCSTRNPDVCLVDM